MEKGKPEAKSQRLVAAIANASIAAGVNSPFLETIAENELEEASLDLPCSRRFGKSGLSSGRTLDLQMIRPKVRVRLFAFCAGRCVCFLQVREKDCSSDI